MNLEQLLVEEAAALLLFVSEWDSNTAMSVFSAIAKATGHADRSLGNVMGLNSFHHYQACAALKQLQELKHCTSRADGRKI